MNSDVDTIDIPKCSFQYVRKNNQRLIGLAILRRLPSRANIDLHWNIELYEFLDNEQFSNFDSFLVSLGSCEVILNEELEDTAKPDNRKILNFIYKKNLKSYFVKRALYKKVEMSNALKKLTGKDTQYFVVAEVSIANSYFSSKFTKCSQTERQLAYSCLQCLIFKLSLLDEEEYYGKYDIEIASLSQYMKLDSAAAEAVNLLPKADHPSKFGSLYGVLNRCKTKMGCRLLERHEKISMFIFFI